MITIEKIIELSPAVSVVLAGARTSIGRYWEEYEFHKRLLKGLVGWDAPDGAPDELRTSEAYELAIGALFDALDGRQASA